MLLLLLLLYLAAPPRATTGLGLHLLATASTVSLPPCAGEPVRSGQTTDEVAVYSTGGRGARNLPTASRIWSYDFMHLPSSPSARPLKAPVSVAANHGHQFPSVRMAPHSVPPPFWEPPVHQQPPWRIACDNNSIALGDRLGRTAYSYGSIIHAYPRARPTNPGGPSGARRELIGRVIEARDKWNCPITAYAIWYNTVTLPRYQHIDIVGAMTNILSTAISTRELAVPPVTS